MAFLKFFLAAWVMSLCACDLIRAPTPIELTGTRPSVHALVIAGSTTVQVQVYSVDPARDPQGSGGSIVAPISGARVFIASSTERIQLQEFATVDSVCNNRQSAERLPAAGCYGGSLSRPIAPGETYSLHVELPGGGMVDGRARTPSVPQIIEPHANAHVRSQVQAGLELPYVETPMVWTIEPHVGAGNVQLMDAVPFRNGSAVKSDGRCTGVEILIHHEEYGVETLRVIGLGCFENVKGTTQPIAWDSLHATLRLTAFDSAFSHYLAVANTSKVAEAEASIGITGALGVFGGAAFTDVPLTILAPLK
jgi:hypothetical protein